MRIDNALRQLGIHHKLYEELEKLSTDQKITLTLALLIVNNKNVNSIMIKEQDFLDALKGIDDATSAIAARVQSLTDQLAGDLTEDQKQAILDQIKAETDKLNAIGKPETPAGAGSTPVPTTPTGTGDNIAGSAGTALASGSTEDAGTTKLPPNA